MTIIKIRRKYYEAATDWDELTADQLLEIIDIFSTKEYQPEQTVLKLLKTIIGLSTAQFLRLKAEDLEEYIYLTGFLIDGSSCLTKQLIPVYDHLYGPDDEIGNMIMKEFVFSEHYFMQWQEDKDKGELMNHFIATIYRPSKENYDFDKNPDGDCRVEFNENICAWHAKEFVQHWPENIKIAIAHWYAGCRQKIVDDNPDVFGESGEKAKHGLISIMRDIAKQGAHGTFEAVENMNVPLVMIELNEIVEEGKRIEEQIKKHS